jgi:hypothetical protein
MDETRLTRRRLLRGTVGLTAVGLAGCTSSSGGPSGGSTESSPGDGSGESDDPAGHGESEQGHGGVGEPKDAREVAVDTVSDGETATTTSG